ncbi:MAG: DUF1801 domain-containing protein [Ferruginibacter sp.]
MQSTATTVEAYVEALPEDRKAAITKLRKVILKNLPKGFKEEMSYGMIGYVVPHSIYPDGYHCTPNLPLPFMNLASQKNAISIYHMGLYANAELMNWFTAEYAKQVPSKLDMGKSCVRLKKIDQIPYELIGELVKKVTVKDWIGWYETQYKKR